MSTAGPGPETGPGGPVPEELMRELNAALEPAADSSLAARALLQEEMDQRLALAQARARLSEARLRGIMGESCQQCQACVDDIRRNIGNRLIAPEEAASLCIWQACTRCPELQEEVDEIRGRIQWATAPGPGVPVAPTLTQPTEVPPAPAGVQGATLASVPSAAPTAEAPGAAGPAHPACALLPQPPPGQNGVLVTPADLERAGYVWPEGLDRAAWLMVFPKTCDASGCIQARHADPNSPLPIWITLCPQPRQVRLPAPPPAGPACIPLCSPQCPPEREWVLWRGQDGACYLARSDQLPRNPGDEQLARSVDAAGLAQELLRCTRQPEEESARRAPPLKRLELSVKSEVQCPVEGWTGETASDIAASLVDIDTVLSTLLGQGVTAESLWDATWRALTSGDLLSVIAGLLMAPMASIAGSIKAIFLTLLRPLGCESDKYDKMVGPRLLLSFLRHWFIPDLDSVLLPWRYLTQSECPTCFPDVNEARTAYLRGTIDERTYIGWQRQNNRCPEPELRVVDAMQASLTPSQAVLALWRGAITPERYREEIRRNGWLRQDAADMWLRLAEPIPPITDLIRFMVRDTADPAVVSRFRMDDLFHDKFQGQVRQWAEQQGITEEVARHYWRAHWSIPSPTQLFEMFHRSRGLPDGHPAKVTYDDVRAALVQQDILPVWIDPLLETTYSLLRLVDIRRALEIGAIDAEEVRKQLVRRGYSDHDAEVLTQYYIRSKQRAFRNHPAVQQWRRGDLDWLDVAARLRADGATEDTIEDIRRAGQRHLLRLPLLSQYAQGILTWDEARARLERLGADPLTIEQAHEQGLRRRVAQHRRRCLMALKGRVMTGELERPAAIQLVWELVGDAVEATQLVDLWLCEQRFTSRQVSAAQMCGWIERGLLTADEMLDRLIRLGYSQGDALRVLAACGIDIAERTRRRLEAERKKREAEQRRIEAELARQRREEERRTRERERRLAQLRRARERRERRLAELLARVTELVEQPADAVTAVVRGLIRDLTQTTPLSPDERLQVLEDAILRRRPRTLEELQDAVRETAEQHLAAEELSDGASGSSNGDGAASS